MPEPGKFNDWDQDQLLQDLKNQLNPEKTFEDLQRKLDEQEKVSK